MSNDTTITERPSGESQIGLLKGTVISVRGWMALVLTLTLCVGTIKDPEQFAEAFKITVTAVVSFYFGQKVGSK
jgi:hypothetical protein